MNTEAQSPSDYLAIIKRRKYYFSIPFLSVCIVSAFVAFVLPPIYKSTSTILIEGQQIPSELVQSTVTTAVEETIQTITQQVMSRTKLLKIVNRFDLYKDRRAIDTTEEIIERMRDDIHLETISADMIDQRTGRPSVATIAFSLSYKGKEQEKVQKVANVLTSLYLEQNLKDREEKARTTSSFIEAELESIRGLIDELEMKIAKFKEKHLHSLPEMSQLNFQMVQRIEQDLNKLDRQIKNIKERKIYLEGQLLSVDPDLPGIKDGEGKYADVKQRLEYLNTEYISLKASLSGKHPDLIKIRKEIKSLEKEVNFKKKIEIKQNHLERMNTDLASKKARLSRKHPDIIKLRKSIRILEAEIEYLIKERPETREAVERPDNPAYINLKTQIATAEMDLQSLKRTKAETSAKLSNYLTRLELTPKIEMDYQLLTRDYENARVRYQKTLNKLMEARTAEGLERDQKAQKFTIIDPAIYPEKPFKPNRAAIILIGLVLGLGGGVGLSALKEFSDQSVWSETQLRQLTDRQVLAVIPLIKTDADVKDKRGKTVIYATLLVISFLLFIMSMHMFYKPLDVLWFKVMRKTAEITAGISFWR